MVLFAATRFQNTPAVFGILARGSLSCRSGGPIIEAATMKTIILRGGSECFVSDEDYDFLSRWKWKLNSNGYACRNTTVTLPTGKVTRMILMNRLIARRMGMNIDELEVDHNDRNKLNNQRRNLTPRSHTHNAWNTVRKAGATGVRGVSFNKNRSLYYAQIRIGNGKRLRLGHYATIEEAKAAYDKAKQERDSNVGITSQEGLW